MGQFSLTSADLSVTGIRVKGGRLRILPSGPVLVLGAAQILFGGGLVAVAVIVTPLGIRLWFGVLGAVLMVSGWRAATTRLVADATGLRVRNHWRTVRIPWADVARIESAEQHRSMGRQPYSSPWRGPKDFVEGRVVLATGRTIVCDAMVSEPASAGLATPGGLVSAEVKQAVVTRWQAHLQSG